MYDPVRLVNVKHGKDKMKKRRPLNCERLLLYYLLLRITPRTASCTEWCRPRCTEFL